MRILRLVLSLVMKANTTLFCDACKYRVFTLYTREEHNVTCQFHLGQNKHNRQEAAEGCWGESLQQGSEPRRPRPPRWSSFLPGRLDGGSAPRFCEFPDASAHGDAWKYLPSRQFAVLIQACLACSSQSCLACSSQSCFCPHVPTSPHQATRRPSRAHPHVLGAPRPSKASPARPSPPAHLLICGPLLCLRPLQPLSPLCPSRLCWAVSSFFPLLLWVPQTVCTLKKKKNFRLPCQRVLSCPVSCKRVDA